MMNTLRGCFLLFLLWCGAWVHAEPEEAALCKAQGYPVGTARTWFMERCFRVGSFSHHAEIPGIFGGVANTMQAASRPLELGRATQEPPMQWSVSGLSGLTIDDYLNRQPAMALLIVKDGVIQVERYRYGRTAEHRFLSNSMAKTITAMGIGIALREGKIKSLDERADLYAPTLAGTLYGETTIRNLLRMSSGAKFEEVYNGKDDLARVWDCRACWWRCGWSQGDLYASTTSRHSF